MSALESVSVADLVSLADQHQVELIDVRTPAEFRQVHAVIARNTPLETLDPSAVMKQRSGGADQPLFVICLSGNRSTKACRLFIGAGYTNVIQVKGGMSAWEAAGFPVVRGKRTMALERQVRIAAGLLVLLGAGLSFWNLYFALLAGIVGAGLMFSGITDSCPMALTIAKLPWNQVTIDTASCGSSDPASPA